MVAGAKALHEAGVVGDRMAMAETVVSALAGCEDVRAALVRAITHHENTWAEPDHEAGPAIRPWPLVDTIQAALGDLW